MTSDDIRALRTELGLTQAQLAKKLGVNRIVISHWETGVGKPGESSIARMQALAGDTEPWRAIQAAELRAAADDMESWSDSPALIQHFRNLADAIERGDNVPPAYPDVDAP